jgi:DNA-binding XRE family transcriptional regulator
VFGVLQLPLSVDKVPALDYMRVRDLNTLYGLLPDMTVLDWRFRHGRYPAQHIKKDKQGRWLVSTELAKHIVIEEQLIASMVPASKLAETCGLTPYAFTTRFGKTIPAKKIHRQWYMTHKDFNNVVQYYKEAVPTAKAAKLIGVSKKTIHKMIERGLPFLILGTEKRIVPSVLLAFAEKKQTA